MRRDRKNLLVRCWTLSVGCSTLILFTSSSWSDESEDKDRPIEFQTETKQPPREDSLDRLKGLFRRLDTPKEEIIPIETNAPPREDSLDRLKKLWPKKKPGEATDKADSEPSVDQQSPFEKITFQLKDYNWEQNVNFRIGNFTILGYRDATSNDRMLFRFLTPQEHAEKRVMNSKASLLYSPPKKKSVATPPATPNAN